ncbi:MAG: acetyl-CoA carboxylase biotin carboxyl carrier protein [Bacteroidia bacterium]|jgi:acetyl-CoA carboxylase biotin carboxyl carrier protein
MELKEIQDLIRFVAKSGVSEVELESKGFKIVIKTGNAQEIIRVAEPTVIHAQVPVASAPAPVAATPAAPAAPIAAAPVADDSSKYVTIKSPMIGTFYRSSGPGKPLFVNVGDEITAGKAVCIIEAMKLFNEIESEISGTIVKVLVNDATPVEYDQPLFLVEPK